MHNKNLCFSDIIPLFLYLKNNSDSVNENINRLLEDSKVFLDKRRSKKKESKWDYFNIFSAISDTYKKENYCSDILKLILDPNTDEIGNPKYLYEFLLFIGISEKEIKKCFNDFSEIKVTREEQRIDVLIKNKKYAVIIENKVNRATDRPMQIPRYYKALKDEGLIVLKILYLTILPDKKPDYSYDLQYMNYIGKNEDGSQNKDFISKKDYEKLVIEVNKRLVCKSATSSLSNDSFCDFLDKCIELTNGEKQNTLAKIFIEQYSKLLKKLGGELEMLEPEKELIKEIYSSTKNIQNAEDFVEVWEKRESILAEIFREKFTKISSNTNWEFVEKERIFYKELITDKLWIYYAPWCWNQIGFYTDKIKTKKNAEPLLDLLSTLNPDKLTYSCKPSFDKEGWIYVDCYYKNEPIDEYFKAIFAAISKLEKAFYKVEKTIKI